LVAVLICVFLHFQSMNGSGDDVMSGARPLASAK
jgi:hypothetical protein